MTDPTLGGYTRHEKHDAADFARAEFARHENGNIAVRGHAPLGGRPWSTAGWVEYTDAQMAQDGGWSPVRECPDKDVHWRYDEAQNTIQRLTKERDEARRHEGVAAEQATEQARLAQEALRERDRVVARSEQLARERYRADRKLSEAEGQARGWMKTSEEWQATAEEWEKRALAAESRPLSPDAITDEMVKRALDAADRYEAVVINTRIMREALTAALTEPPARPEGAEAIEAVLRAKWATAEDEGFAALADVIASSVRVVTEEQA